jgi:DNA-directed RNA polymerase specialized sigma24 family protein
LRVAIETLPPATRRVIVLLLDGVSRADVAAKLDMTENNVDGHFREAKKMLAPKKRTRT